MDVRRTPGKWAELKYVRVLSDPAWVASRVLLTEEQFDSSLALRVFELLPGHPARLVPPPSSSEGYVVLALADDLLEEFDVDDESLDLIDVYDWLVRRARELGAR